ncbi:hypothetical protein EUGRSUZ_L03354 [Eucalyptus grandis]|uniref:Uncharacterized protein n=1 Tax=Eucalyptus grandis TaxID=71139 RepID=A0AAD9T8H4_EUCGR|nr:hypothetical protein EUGRSUZ_L03354 [Eucalyptus grandis]
MESKDPPVEWIDRASVRAPRVSSRRPDLWQIWATDARLGLILLARAGREAALPLERPELLCRATIAAQASSRRPDLPQIWASNTRLRLKRASLPSAKEEHQKRTWIRKLQPVSRRSEESSESQPSGRLRREGRDAGKGRAQTKEKGTNEPRTKESTNERRRRESTNERRRSVPVLFFVLFRP